MLNESVNSSDKMDSTTVKVGAVEGERGGGDSPLFNKDEYKIISSRDADITLKFQEEYDSTVAEITPEEEKKLSKKVQWFIISFTCLVDLLLYMDKTTLSYAVILGLFQDTGLSHSKYSNVNTIFYCGFILGQIPGQYFLQKLPIGKYLFGIIISWSALILLNCAASSYGGILALRFFLGISEASILPLLNVTLGQFLTTKEKAASAPLFYTTCIGSSIPIGFIAYGVLHLKTSFALWKVLHLIIGCLTFLLSILVFFWYPNNPADAKFLSTEERIWVIRRVQSSTGASIEQKVFKRYQFMETLKDPITWLFALFFLLQQLANNLIFQKSLLFTEMGGVTPLDSTLVSVASGCFGVVCCLIASFFLARFSNLTAYSVAFWSLPAFVGSIVAVTLPWSNKIGLLAAICLAGPTYGIPFICMFSWNMTSCSGYTKRLTRGAVALIFYCFANLISPQLWRDKDYPRFYPAWTVQIVLSFFTAPAIALVIRFILNKRNVERLDKVTEKDRIGVVESSEEEVVVDVAVLDLTDLENEAFIYPL